jgi:outer membrane protein assembly factor BamE (lipoprotein component of BamABCDE complex)
MKSAMRSLAPLLLLLAIGCSPTIDNRGHVLREAALVEIKPGVHRREDVQQLMGSPSTVAPFDSSTWVYVGEKAEQVAFLEPKVTERHVVVVHFDESGTVDSIKRLNRDDGREVDVVDRTTATAGNELTFLEQLLGNVGRFSGGPGGSTSVPGT